MSVQSEGFYTFVVEWFDAQAALVRSYQLRYYAGDGQLEMVDLKTKRLFLKKCHYPSVTLPDLYPGSQITVYSRNLKIIDYGDEHTRSALAAHKQPAMVVLKSSDSKDIANFVAGVTSNSLVLAGLKLATLTSAQAAAFGAPELAGRAGVFAHVVGVQAPATLRQWIQGAQAQSVWAKCVVAASPEDTSRQIELVFGASASGVSAPAGAASAAAPVVAKVPAPPAVKAQASFGQVAMCVVRPHAVLNGSAGDILKTVVQAGFSVTGLGLFVLDRQAAQEFLEVYRMVVPIFHSMVEQLTSGPCLAVELQLPSAPEQVIPRFAELAGPMDPDVARRVRPNTLRARFGQNKVMNGVHCTYLPEDGLIESQFFFDILQQ